MSAIYSSRIILNTVFALGYFSLALAFPSYCNAGDQSKETKPLKDSKSTETNKKLPSIPWNSGAKPAAGVGPDAAISTNPPKMNFKPIELEGEVVDAWCWSSGVMGEGRGPKHHSCGLACVLGGVSCGIVDDNNNLYIAAKNKAYKGCNQMLAKYVAKRVKVKGWITERGGCKLLKINEVTEIGPAEKYYK